MADLPIMEQEQQMSSTISALTSGGGLAMAGDTSGQLELKTNNGTTAMTITTAQAVGIGTATPTGQLSVKGANGISAERSNDTDRITTTYDGINQYANASGAYNYNGCAFTQSNISGSTQNFRMTTTGALVFGTATSENGQNSISMSNSSDAASYGRSMLFNTQYNSTRNAVSFQYNSSGVGTIVTGTSSTSYNTSSDYRLKDNIAPMTNALATVSALKPVTYKWKLDGSNGQGFIAHELQEIVPDAVSGVKDAIETYTDEDGNEQTRIKPQGIDTSFLVATLTAAIQELNAKVDAQALEIQALKGVAL
jgi:hypothetical protein